MQYAESSFIENFRRIGCLVQMLESPYTVPRMKPFVT